MGMHVGFIAAKTNVARFQDAFSSTWKEFDVVAVENKLADANAMWAWKTSHEKFVPAAQWTKNDGAEVFVFWQDKEWAVMMDATHTLASDEDGLKMLSIQLGTVISFDVETASGCADFFCFGNGRLRRRISSDNADVSTDGEPLAEETGIDIGNYYLNETAALWKAFGLSPLDEMSAPDGYRAICVVDRTDYSGLVPTQARFTTPKKPWWKFW